MARLAGVDSNVSFLRAGVHCSGSSFAFGLGYVIRHFSVLGFGVDTVRLDSVAHFTEARSLNPTDRSAEARWRTRLWANGEIWISEKRSLAALGMTNFAILRQFFRAVRNGV